MPDPWVPRASYAFMSASLLQGMENIHVFPSRTWPADPGNLVVFDEYL